MMTRGTPMTMETPIRVNSSKHGPVCLVHVPMFCPGHSIYHLNKTRRLEEDIVGPLGPRCFLALGVN